MRYSHVILTTLHHVVGLMMKETIGISSSFIEGRSMVLVWRAKNNILT